MVLCMIAMASYAQETEDTEKEAVTLPTLTVTAQKEKRHFKRCLSLLLLLTARKQKNYRSGTSMKLAEFHPISNLMMTAAGHSQ